MLAADLRVDRPQHGELAHHDLVGGQRDQRAARHGIDRHVDRHLGRVRLHRAGDLHGRQHQPARRVQDEVDGHVGWRFLDGGDDGLGVLQVDVAPDREAEQSRLLLAVDHGDDAGAVRLLDGPDRLGTAHAEPAARKQGLQRQKPQEHPEQGREIERHGGALLHRLAIAAASPSVAPRSRRRRSQKSIVVRNRAGPHWRHRRCGEPDATGTR
jgi:hypothetical protein